MRNTRKLLSWENGKGTRTQQEIEANEGWGTRSDLNYYLGRVPTNEEVAEADEWLTDHPGGNLAEYVEAMQEIDAL